MNAIKEFLKNFAIGYSVGYLATVAAQNMRQTNGQCGQPMQPAPEAKPENSGMPAVTPKKSIVLGNAYVNDQGYLEFID